MKLEVLEIHKIKKWKPSILLQKRHNLATIYRADRRKGFVVTVDPVLNESFESFFNSQSNSKTFTNIGRNIPEYTENFSR